MTTSMKDIALDSLRESLSVKEACITNNLDLIVLAARRIATCLASGHKLLIFGNGGSAADAQHMAAEFINRFQMERSPLPAVALTTDSSVLTSIGNDYGFELVFTKQVQALGKPDDIAIGISTSGNSPNVIHAIKKAKRMDLFTMGWTGAGGELADLADMVFRAESKSTARIQEAHITIGHILCDLVEKMLFP